MGVTDGNGSLMGVARYFSSTPRAPRTPRQSFVVGTTRKGMIARWRVEGRGEGRGDGGGGEADTDSTVPVAIYARQPARPNPSCALTFPSTISGGK